MKAAIKNGSTTEPPPIERDVFQGLQLLTWPLKQMQLSSLIMYLSLLFMYLSLFVGYLC